MGDPKKPRKKYQGPSHPWQKQRIIEENELMATYGLKNKKELWKMGTLVKQIAAKAKRVIAATGEQADKEQKQLIEKLVRLGLIENSAKIDDVLGLTLKNILERRLQTLVFKKNMSRSVKQARQFITHRHIKVNGRKVTSPSYLVPLDQENTIIFSENSLLADQEHPERVSAPTKIAEKTVETKGTTA